MRPKVAFYVFFPAGGIGRYTNELLNELVAQDEMDVELICPPDFNWQASASYAHWSGLGSISHSIPTVRRARFLLRQFTNPLRAIRHASDTDSDIIHFCNVNHLSFPFWRSALKRSGLFVGISVHDVRRQKSIVNRAWEERNLKELYRTADALFVHTQSQATELRSFCGVSSDRIHVVPHGSYSYGKPSEAKEVLRDRYCIPKDKSVALFFGQIRDEKGLEAFLEAMVLASQDFHLLVAGQPSSGHKSPSFYHDKVNDLALNERVTLKFGHVPDEAVGDLFELVDWVCLPYTHSFTSQSGVLSIAAFYDKPVLVTDAISLSETVRNSDIGVIATGDDPAALAKGISSIYVGLSQGRFQGFEFHKNLYSWKENAERTHEVYRRLTSSPSHTEADVELPSFP